MAQDYGSIRIVWLQGQLNPSLSQMQHDALPLFLSMGVWRTWNISYTA